MKIGVFDSGLGGLTIVNEFLQQLKGVSIFYIADTKNAPYGDKKPEEIYSFSKNITEFFIKKHNIDILVIACNTATSIAVANLRKNYNLTIIGIEPGIKPAILESKTKQVGVLATLATLNGKKYQQLASKLSNEHKVKIYEQPCKGLVEQIEKGEIDSNKTKDMLKNWLTPMQQAKVDTIVLGCTHYPLVANTIKKLFSVKLIETAKPLTKHLISKIEKQNNSQTTLKIYTTGKIELWLIEHILKKKVEIEFLKI